MASLERTGAVNPIFDGKLANNLLLTEMDDFLRRALLEQIEHGDLDINENEDAIASASIEVTSELATTCLKTLRRCAQMMLRERRSQLASFEKRTFSRWRKAFDLFEMMVVMAEELGESNDAALRAKARQEQDYKFEAWSWSSPGFVDTIRL